MIKLLKGLSGYRFAVENVPPVVSEATASGKDKYRKYHKNGP